MAIVQKFPNLHKFLKNKGYNVIEFDIKENENNDLKTKDVQPELTTPVNKKTSKKITKVEVTNEQVNDGGSF